ncbi:MAG TPA: DUF547 domain-containing protein [Chroococcales cyanobacterium]
MILLNLVVTGIGAFMKIGITLFSLALSLSCQSVFAFDQTHKLFSEELAKYVDGGRVHYKRWQSDQTRLLEYLDAVAAIKPEELSAMTAAEKEALWLNVYNAFTIKLVLDNYPIKETTKFYPPDSLRQVPDVWEEQFVTVAGQKYSIDQIEHAVLRKDFHDERIHFAQNAAASGSGALRARAFTPDTLDTDLADLTEHFLFDKKNVNFDFDKKTVSVSYIFNWFPLDFTKAAGFCKRKFPPPPDDEIVLAYLAKHFAPVIEKNLKNPAEIATFRVKYLPFDWTLNDADCNRSLSSAVK